MRSTRRGLAGPCARGHDGCGPSPPRASIVGPVATTPRRRVSPSPRAKTLPHYALISRAHSRGRAVPRSMHGEGRAANRLINRARHPADKVAGLAPRIERR